MVVMKRTVIHFMRHGEVHNPKRVLYSRLPKFGISVKGKEAVEASIRKLEGTGISRIYVSPLLRTRQTAAIARRILDVPVHMSSRIIEVRSPHAGVSLEEYYGKLQYRMYDAESIAKGHESVEEIADRMQKFLRLIVRRHEGERMLVISHADPILILMTSMRGIPFTWEWKKANYLQTACFLTVECQGESCSWK